jgi:hypothetical protein
MKLWKPLKNVIIKIVVIVLSFITILVSQLVYGQPPLQIELFVNGDTIEKEFKKDIIWNTFDTLTINIHDELGIYNILPNNSNDRTIFAPLYTNSDATFYNCDSIFEPNISNIIDFFIIIMIYLKTVIIIFLLVIL